MVGKAILLECLASDKISEVLVVNRSSLSMKDPKLKEVNLKDFMDFKSISKDLKNYDACFHCMGVSTYGLNEKEYTALTFDITKNLVDVLFEANHKMQVNYVSGMGTDSSEKGSSMWGRVKGKTENYILNKGFSRSLMFRPGLIIPEDGIVSKTKLYNLLYTVLKPFNRLLKKSKHVTTGQKMGLAMIASLSIDLNKKYIENKEINQFAKNEIS